MLIPNSHTWSYRSGAKCAWLSNLNWVMRFAMRASGSIIESPDRASMWASVTSNLTWYPGMPRSVSTNVRRPNPPTEKSSPSSATSSTLTRHDRNRWG